MAYKKSNANGQATMANSEPVVLASDQAAIPVTVAGVATAALQSTQDTSINTLLKPASTLTAVTTVTNLSQQGGVAISLNTGVRDTGTQRVTIATNDVVPVTLTSTTITGSVAVTGPLTDTQLRATAVPVSGTVTVTGVATETTLAALNTKTATAKTFDLDTGAGTDTVQALGLAVAASGGSVAITGDAANGLDVDVTRLPALPAGTNNIGDVDVLTVNGVAPAFGTGVRGATVQRVTVATDDLVPVSAASLPLPTGASTLAEQQTQTTALGGVTETAPATDTASSGLNGRLQRIAQRITTLITTMGSPFQAGGSIGNTAFIANAGTNLNTSALNLETTQTAMSAKLPATLGQKAMVASMAVVLASDQASVPVTLSSTAITGTVASTQSGTWTVQPGNTPNSTPWLVSGVASVAGGYTPNKLISAATTNATVIKGSAGTLGYVQASNINAAARYLKMYNKATAPTVGTDVPVHVWLIPGNTAGAGTNIPIPSEGVNFSAGISFAITAGAADIDTTAVAASEIIVNYGSI